jgi:cyanophycinase
MPRFPFVMSRPALALALLLPLGSQLVRAQSSAPRVGPARGSVVVVGGGVVGPEIVAKFIELAGGPDALIIDVPTAGGDSTYPANWRGANFLKAGGAKHIVVLHTTDRSVANADSFAAVLKGAGGVWFEGGRQWHLADSYGGTKTEQAFHDVLARGGVAGGSSAGASILSSYMLRGARAGNEAISAPGYEVGFGFLRNVAIDQHVVARERLPDLADSLMPRHPELLGISEDEGTAWVVRGDTADIIGRNKAFVYGGRDATDPGAPFLTLRPGDRYDVAARRVTHRAADDSPVKSAYVDSLFAGMGVSGSTMATVLVARDGKVFVDRSYGIPPQLRYMPTTTVPNFALGGLADGYQALAAQLLARDGKVSLDDPVAEGSTTTVRQLLSNSPAMPDGRRALAELLAKRAGSTYPVFIERRLFTPIGAHKTVASASGEMQGNVDELYRWALALDQQVGFGAPLDMALGWKADRYRGSSRLATYGLGDGKRSALLRFPDQHAVVIVLTSSDAVDARAIAERVADKLLF